MRLVFSVVALSAFRKDAIREACTNATRYGEHGKNLGIGGEPIIQICGKACCETRLLTLKCLLCRVTRFPCQTTAERLQITRQMRLLDDVQTRLERGLYLLLICEGAGPFAPGRGQHSRSRKGSVNARCLHSFVDSFPVSWLMYACQDMMASCDRVCGPTVSLISPLQWHCNFVNAYVMLHIMPGCRALVYPPSALSSDL